MLPDTIRTVLQKYEVDVHSLIGMELIIDLVDAIHDENIVIPRVLANLSSLTKQEKAERIVEAFFGD